MMRSFCLGALAGFFFGSSKTGVMIRSRVDGFLTDLLGGNEPELKLAEGDELAEENESGRSRKLSGVGGGRRQSARAGYSEHKAEDMDRPKSKSARAPKEQKAKHDAEPAQPDKKDSGTAHGESSLPLDKAQELADKLNAKPTTPPDEEAPAM